MSRDSRDVFYVRRKSQFNKLLYKGEEKIHQIAAARQGDLLWRYLKIADANAQFVCCVIISKNTHAWNPRLYRIAHGRILTFKRCKSSNDRAELILIWQENEMLR